MSGTAPPTIDRPPRAEKPPSTTRPPRAASPRRRLDASVLIPLAIVALIAYLTIIPIGMMLKQSIESADGSFSWDNYRTILTSPTAWGLIRGSFIFALGSTIMGTLVGSALAGLVERTNMPFRRMIFGAALVPLIMPGSLATFAWVLILSPSVGVVNVELQNLFGFETGPLNIYSMPGMIFVEGIHLSTLSFLLMAGALRSMDASLEEASSSSGAATLETARRITMPLLLPAILSNLLIGFVRAIEGFEVPAMLGIPGKEYVLASQIYLALKTFPVDYGLAGTYSMLLFVVGALGVILYLRVLSKGGFETITGKGFRPRQIDLRVWKWPALGFGLLYVAGLFVLPGLMMIWTSFLPFYQAPSVEALESLTLDNYRQVFESGSIVSSAQNSFLLAVFAATFVVIIAAISAWITVRTKLPGRQLIDIMAFVPIAIPGLVLGVAMTRFYAGWSIFGWSIPIYGTLAILVIAFVIKFLPYGMRQATSTVMQVGRELEEASSVAGASWSETFFRVLLPLLRPGLFAAWVYIFIVSTRELSTSIILSGASNRPLAVLIYSLYANGKFTVLSALGCLMVAVLTLLVLGFQRLGGRPVQE